MHSFSSDSSYNPVASWTLGLVVLALYLVLLPPWRPGMPTPGFDPSWAYVLHESFAEGRQWGTDIILSYGPLGFLVINVFHPDTYLLLLGVQVVLAMVLFVSVFGLVRHLPPLGGLLVHCVVILTCITVRDTAIFIFPLVFALYCRSENDRFVVFWRHVLLAVCAVLSLSKFTAAMLALVAVIVCDVSMTRRQRPVPWYLIMYVLFIVAWYVAAGQDLAYMGTYLRGALEFASGYSYAMQVSGPAVEIVVAVAAGLMLIGLALPPAALSPRREIPVVLSLAAFLFLSYKTAFVRHDSSHVITIFMSLAVAATLFGTVTSRPTRSRSVGVITAIVVLVSIGFGYAGPSQAKDPGAVEKWPRWKTAGYQ